MNFRTRDSVDGVKALISMFLLSAVGNSVLVIQPLTVGAMVDLMRFSDRQAGMVVFAELASFSFGSALMAGLIHRVNRHHSAYLGIALIALGNGLSAVLTDFAPFVSARAISGFGCALPIASFIGTAVLTRVPDRTFGVVNATSIGYSGLLLFLAPAVMHAGGLKLVYLGMGAAAIIYAAAVRWIPSRAPRHVRVPRAVDGPVPVQEGQMVGGKYLGQMWAAVLVVMLLLYAGHGAVWAFQERIGVAFGIGKQDIGTALGIAMLVGILGSLLAWVLGLAIGRVWPQVLSLGLSVAAAVLLVSGGSFAHFALASSLITFTWFYGLPYQMGLLARLDPKGRANVAGVVMTTGGAALGPAIAAAIISPGEYTIIGWFASICYLLCLVLVLPAAIRIERLEKEGAVERPVVADGPL